MGVGFFGQVGQGDPYRHVGGLKSAAVQENHRFFFRQPDHEINPFVILDEIIGECLAVAGFCQAGNVNGGVIVGVVDVFRVRNSHRFIEGFKPVSHYTLGGFLVVTFFIDEIMQGEEYHHDLLGSGEARSVVQGHGARVGHHALDELHVIRVEGDTAVTGV